MIESCSKKRMVLGLSLLGGLTILVLIFESHWAGGNHNHLNSGFGKNSTDRNHCWLHEDYSVVDECHPCTAFEVASGSLEVCQDTHFKETLLCQHSGKVTRSCDKVKWLEERNFWLFEGSMLFVGVVATSVAFFRQKVLDHRMLKRLQRQLAASV